MAFLIVVITLYILAVAVCAALGFLLVTMYAEFGAEDDDYQRGKLLIKYCMLPLVALVKIYRNAVQEAEGGDDND